MEKNHEGQHELQEHKWKCKFIEIKPKEQKNHNQKLGRPTWTSRTQKTRPKC
jgi:hypothetical protein